MIDVTPNIPEVVAEVRDLFERYEQALIDRNVDVLDATFWNSPHTIRYAFHENGASLIVETWAAITFQPIVGKRTQVWL